MTINPEDLDGPDAVTHWRERHDHIKTRSNAQFQELEAVRWELQQAKDEVKALRLERVRLHEQRQSDLAIITEANHKLEEALADLADAKAFAYGEGELTPEEEELADLRADRSANMKDVG